MPLFSGPSPLEMAIEKATNEANTSEDWALILEICDQVQVEPTAAKDCLRILLKRLGHPNPHVVLYTLTLLDACVNNCGKRFHLEICSREFESEFKRVLNRTTQTKIVEKMLTLIKKWAESKEFTDDPALTLVPTLYRQLKEKYRFPSTTDDKAKVPAQLPTDPNVVTSNQEEEDIAKAIALSLQESTPSKTFQAMSPTSTFKTMSSSAANNPSVYPSFDLESTSYPSSSPVKESYQVRALYDFEAAEDNELTLKAGEIVVVTDDSHESWWKGSNHRGEGLFPSNFVTTDLTEPEGAKSKKGVQFNEEVKVKLLESRSIEPVTIDEEKMDRLLHLLHEADPTGDNADSDELLTLEEQCTMMSPLIDEELEKVDRRIASLSGVNTQLVQAMDLYHSLMRDHVAQTSLYSSQPNNVQYQLPTHLGQMPMPPPQQQQQPYPVYQANPQEHYTYTNGTPYYGDPSPAGHPGQVDYSHGMMGPPSQPQQHPTENSM